MKKRNHAWVRIWTDVGFQPVMLQFPDCQCKDCEHAYDDVKADDGTLFFHGYDGGTCKVYKNKSLDILRGKIKCPYRQIRTSGKPVASLSREDE